MSPLLHQQHREIDVLRTTLRSANVHWDASMHDAASIYDIVKQTLRNSIYTVKASRELLKFFHELALIEKVERERVDQPSARADSDPALGSLQHMHLDDVSVMAKRVEKEEAGKLRTAAELDKVMDILERLEL